MNNSMEHRKKAKSRNKKYFKMLSIIFVLSIFSVVVLNIITKDKEFSESENRMLAKKPKFTIDRLLEGRFTTKYEKYKLDQFVGRDFFIGVKSKLDRMLGKKENNGVYICEDGYLIEDFDKPNEDNVNTNIDAINNFAKNHKDINQYMLIAPNAVSILKDKLPKYAPVIDQGKYLKYTDKLLNPDIKFINVSNTLNKHNDEYIYYKTDHHWTTRGAYYSFLEAAKVMGIDPNNNKYNIESVSSDFRGTLYSKSGFASKDMDTIDVYLPKDKNDEVIVNYVEEKKKKSTIYSSDKLKTNDKYGVFLEGNHPLVKISTTSTSDKKLMIVKDSYANSFVQFLTPHFSELIMVDPRYFYEDIEKLIKNEGVTDLLYLYNANTFYSDNSLAPVLNNI